MDRVDTNFLDVICKKLFNLIQFWKKKVLEKMSGHIFLIRPELTILFLVNSLKTTFLGNVYFSSTNNCSFWKSLTCFIGCVKAIYCCGESVQNHDPTPFGLSPLLWSQRFPQVSVIIIYYARVYALCVCSDRL